MSSGTKKNDDGTGQSHTTKWVGNSEYGGTSTHVTNWDSNTNKRESYDINPSKSGGWTIDNSHSTDQNESKGSPGRHK